VDPVTVACCQLELAVGQAAANRRAAQAAVRAAALRGAQIVVLPELATSGYVFADLSEATRLAEPLDGETVTGWVQLAARHGLIIVGGLCERDMSDGRPRNSAVIVDGDGVLSAYRKVHLWDRESRWFVAGDAPPPVVSTRHGRIGVIVCYDLEFPEWVRVAALAGADLLCVPTNWPREPRPAGERAGEVVRAQAAAMTNRIFIAACDRAGTERGVDWCNGTVIVGPEGYPLAGPVQQDTSTTIQADLRLADARDKRVGSDNDVLADRRPELYGPVGAAAPSRAPAPR
jgi:predicted amidohydrolase